MTNRPRALAAAILTLLLGQPALSGGPTGLEPTPASPAPTVATDWSGRYFGAAIAIPRGDTTWRIEGTDLALLPGGWTGAAAVLTLGQDWQTGRLTYGASLSVGGGKFLAGPASAVFFTCENCQTTVSNLVTLRGRAGLALGRTLVFASGGLARGSAMAANLDGAVTVGDDTLTGWVAGLGVEHMVADGLSLSLTYDRVDLGPLDLSAYFPSTVSDVRFDKLQVGMNFRW